jgi:hypothetical protein
VKYLADINMFLSYGTLINICCMGVRYSNCMKVYYDICNVVWVSVTVIVLYEGICNIYM